MASAKVQETLAHLSVTPAELLRFVAKGANPA
jgi:hypothetical protein